MIGKKHVLLRIIALSYAPVQEPAKKDGQAKGLHKRLELLVHFEVTHSIFTSLETV